MAARAPRKLFASPFVITLAACGPQPQPAQPQPQPQPDPMIVANPPAPAPPAPDNAATVEQRWTVSKGGSACQAMAHADCPRPKHPGEPVPTCNPPPPMKIECPAGWDGKSPMTVVRYANQTECMIEPPKVSEADCPKASCNPPPPRKITCPSWQ
jgi:hypothetical protein